MGISIWTQYVLDNFATVREAVDELKKPQAAGGGVPHAAERGEQNKDVAVDQYRQIAHDLRHAGAPQRIQQLDVYKRQAEFRRKGGVVQLAAFIIRREEIPHQHQRRF